MFSNESEAEDRAVVRYSNNLLFWLFANMIDAGKWMNASKLVWDVFVVFKVSFVVCKIFYRSLADGSESKQQQWQIFHSWTKFPM